MYIWDHLISLVLTDNQLSETNFGTKVVLNDGLPLMIFH
jgi:hypothetical protein